MKLGFKDLISPITLEDFHRNYWDVKFSRHLAGQSDRFSHLLTWNALNLILAHTESLQHLHIVKDGKPIDQPSYVKNGVVAWILAVWSRRGREDEAGLVLPAAATAGVAQWFTPNFGQGAGRLLVSQPSTGLARNFGCLNEVVLCGTSSMQNSQVTIAAGSNGQMGPYQVDMCMSSVGYCGGDYQQTNPWSANWTSSNSSVASIPTPNGPTTATINGVSAGSATITAAGVPQTNYYQPLDEQWTCYAAQQTGTATVAQVTINSAALLSDQISTSLAPGGLSGTFSLWEVGSGLTDYSRDGVGRSSGNYNDSFGLTAGSGSGQYSQISAAWEPSGTQTIVGGNYQYLFYNYGNTLHSQYTLINESTCSGGSSTAYIITNLSQCYLSGVITTTLNSAFQSQTYTNGTGQSNSYGLLKTIVATSCKGATAGEPAGANANNTFVEVSAVTGVCNQPLSSSTVAQYNHSCGIQVFMEGYGSPGTLKTVEDECPSCGSSQFDDWTPTGGNFSASATRWGLSFQIRLWHHWDLTAGLEWRRR